MFDHKPNAHVSTGSQGAGPEPPSRGGGLPSPNLFRHMQACREKSYILIAKPEPIWPQTLNPLNPFRKHNKKPTKPVRCKPSEDPKGSLGGPGAPSRSAVTRFSRMRSGQSWTTSEKSSRLGVQGLGVRV